VTQSTTELRLPSRIEVVEQVATALAGLIKSSGIDEEAAFGIDLAVREAVTNAVLHGNKADESKFIEVTFKSSPDFLEIKVRDQGLGFNPDDVPDPTDEVNLLKTNGRGIFFMRNFMDEVDWLIHPEGGTTVRMLKKR
jgi:serine/threonine-protein kinase RsbW